MKMKVVKRLCMACLMFMLGGLCACAKADSVNTESTNVINDAENNNQDNDENDAEANGGARKENDINEDGDKSEAAGSIDITNTVTDGNYDYEQAETGEDADGKKSAAGINADSAENDADGTAEEFSYAKLKTLKFSFLSGAGGWSTDLDISEDGSFAGLYHDSDMGSTGNGYPNGTIYWCNFTGKFGELEKVDDLTYKTQIEDIQYINEPGTSEILDGTLYEYTEVYGLEDAKDIIFYLPGTKIKDLPEGYLSWVQMTLNDLSSGEQMDELPYVGLYNENKEEGFYSVNYAEKYLEDLAYTADVAKGYNITLENENLTKDEYEQNAKALYDLWDYSLNQLWSVLKIVLPYDEMNKLTEEQRKWIADKQKVMDKAESDSPDSSKAAAYSYIKGAEYTQERVYELVEIIK